MARLTLDTTGIKSPLDIGAPVEESSAATTPVESNGRAGEERHTPRRPARRTRPATRPQPAAAPTPAPPFYGGGRPIQTSLALDPELAQKLDELSRAAAVPFSSLLVATLHSGLPTTGEQALRAAVTERADRPAGKPRGTQHPPARAAARPARPAHRKRPRRRTPGDPSRPRQRCPARRAARRRRARRPAGRRPPPPARVYSRSPPDRRNIAPSRSGPRGSAAGPARTPAWTPAGPGEGGPPLIEVLSGRHAHPRSGDRSA